MKKALMVFAIVMVTAGAAIGANWALVSGSEEDITTSPIKAVYVDLSSIKNVDQNIVRAWSKFVTSQGHQGRFYSGKIIDYALGLTEYDCVGGKARTLQGAVYYTDGTNSSWNEDNPKWNFIVPDSYENSIYEVVCNF